MQVIKYVIERTNAEHTFLADVQSAYGAVEVVRQ
jgi:hypothetical protein